MEQEVKREHLEKDKEDGLSEDPGVRRPRRQTTPARNQTSWRINKPNVSRSGGGGVYGLLV